jgi:hypothetical protein
MISFLWDGNGTESPLDGGVLEKIDRYTINAERFHSLLSWTPFPNPLQIEVEFSMSDP